MALIETLPDDIILKIYKIIHKEEYINVINQINKEFYTIGTEKEELDYEEELEYWTRYSEALILFVDTNELFL